MTPDQKAKYGSFILASISFSMFSLGGFMVSLGGPSAEKARKYLESKGYEIIRIDGSNQINCPRFQWSTTEFMANETKDGHEYRIHGVVCQDFNGNSEIRLLGRW